MSASHYNINESYGWLIATASQQINQRLTRKFAEHGLNLTTEQWCLLVHLINEDGLTQQELAARNKRSKVTVFKLIGLLEKRGFIHRIPDPKDGRAKRVLLTEYALENKDLMLDLARENLAEVTRGFTDADRESFKVALRKVIENSV
ncbi:MAG: MarR family transcriptional regulator [Desulfobacterales bacterium]|nr:MarR family transcriptional regulator [Desulfobacterales bacterium]